MPLPLNGVLVPRRARIHARSRPPLVDGDATSGYPIGTASAESLRGYIDTFFPASAEGISVATRRQFSCPIQLRLCMRKEQGMEYSTNPELQGYGLDWRMQQYLNKDREAVLLMWETAADQVLSEIYRRILRWADGKGKDENIEDIFGDGRRAMESKISKIREKKSDCIVFVRLTLPKTTKVFHFAGCGRIHPGAQPLNVSDAQKAGLRPCEFCSIEFVS